MTRVLLLAGTTEASDLARRLAAEGIDVISSLAGVTRAPAPRPGRVRSGGFGGAAGLRRYLAEERIDALIDATHPFAATMPFHAAAAAGALGVPRCRVLRAPWSAQDGDRWIAVPDLARAHDAVHALGARRVLLTTGRQSIGAFATCPTVDLVVRAIEAPAGLPAGAIVLLERGPFRLADERRLLLEERVEVVVTKNSGGTATAAKLAAAREIGVPVVMIERPPQPPGTIVATAGDALRWLDELRLCADGVAAGADHPG